MLSGTRVASIPVEELSDVRQRLFLRGDPLADAAKLDSPLDLELVLLEYFAAPETNSDELMAAAARGSPSEVEAILQKPEHPD
ncbi:ANK3, partial [Symbiodinium microadriaticum]